MGIVRCVSAVVRCLNEQFRNVILVPSLRSLSLIDETCPKPGSGFLSLAGLSKIFPSLFQRVGLFMSRGRCYSS